MPDPSLDLDGIEISLQELVEHIPEFHLDGLGFISESFRVGLKANLELLVGFSRIQADMDRAGINGRCAHMPLLFIVIQLGDDEAGLFRFL